MINKIMKGVVAQKHDERRAQLYRNLIRHEAKIGGQLFGEVPKGHRREFFCLDSHTWIWHEEWVDNGGIRRSKTTRYDVRNDGVLKAQDGQPYQKVSLEEVDNLVQAASLYRQRVYQDMYSFAV